MSQHLCATCLRPLRPERIRAGEIICPSCESRWIQGLPPQRPKPAPPAPEQAAEHVPEALHKNDTAPLQKQQ